MLFDKLVDYAKTTPDFAISYELIMTLEKQVAASEHNVRIIDLGVSLNPENYFAEEVNEDDAKETIKTVLIINMANVDDISSSKILHRFHRMTLRKGVIFAFPKGMLMNVSAYHKNRFFFVDV